MTRHTPFQRLWLRRGKLIGQRAALLRARKSTAVVERELKIVTAKIIKHEMRQLNRKAA